MISENRRLSFSFSSLHTRRHNRALSGSHACGVPAPPSSCTSAGCRPGWSGLGSCCSRNNSDGNGAVPAPFPGTSQAASHPCGPAQPVDANATSRSDVSVLLCCAKRQTPLLLLLCSPWRQRWYWQWWRFTVSDQLLPWQAGGLPSYGRVGGRVCCLVRYIVYSTNHYQLTNHWLARRKLDKLLYWHLSRRLVCI
jgi:hypothetical protein